MKKKTTEDERKTFWIIDLNMNKNINGTQYFDRNQFEKKNNIDYKNISWFAKLHSSFIYAF